MQVQHLMSTPVLSLLADQHLPLARELMQFKEVRHLPVVDREGKLVGLVSRHDLARWAGEPRRDELRVEQVMTREVCAVGPETPAATAGRVMLERKYGCVPVIDAHRKLVGIVTESDFMRLAIDAIDAIATAPPLP
jgi:CBS domain-containing protein